MTQLFLQLVQSVAGNVITIVSLGLLAAIAGYLIAWYYAKSVHTPIIKGLEADKADLNSQVVRLKKEYESLNEKADSLASKIEKLNEELAKDKEELKNLSGEKGHVGKFAVSTAKNGEFYFNLKATNGQTILTSVMFHTSDDCFRAIESVRQYSSDDKWFERKTSSDNKHFFTLKSPEGNITGKSEMYESNANMEKGIASVKRNGISTIVVEE
jgi:uncharacterized protein